MPLGRYFGVRVRLHPLFLLLIAVAFLGGRVAEALIVLVLLVTHELAHLLVASAYHLEVTEVELLPFGGVAQVEGLPEAEPGVEPLVALAGPLNNLLLLAVGTLLRDLPLFDARLVQFFIEGNLGLALFNLLPALPLDGGRVVRGILTRPLGYGRATRMMALCGERIAFGLAAAGLAGLMAGAVVPNAFVLAVFLYFAAAREGRLTTYGEMQHLWRKREELRRNRVLRVEELVAGSGTTVREVTRHFSGHRYHRVWVTDAQMRILGVVDEAEILHALVNRGIGVTLGDLVDRH